MRAFPIVLALIALAAAATWFLLAREARHELDGPPGSSAARVETTSPALQVADEVRATRAPATAGSAEPDAVLCCRIIDPDTRRPLAGVRAGASDDPLSIEREPIWISDENGLLCARWSRDAAAGLTLLAPGHAPMFVLPRAGHETAESARVIALPRGSSVEIRVVDPAGDPVGDADVRLDAHWSAYALRPFAPVHPALERVARPVRSQHTDADGVARFEGLPDAFFAGSVWRGGREIWRSHRRDVLIQRRAEWRIGTACTIRGVARESDGSRARSIPIAIERSYTGSGEYFSTHGTTSRELATTDDDGCFTFEFVDSGLWLIGPVRDQSTIPHEIQLPDYATFGQPLLIPVGTARLEVELRVERARWIRGRVHGPDGVGRRANLTLTGIDRPSHSRWDTAPNGAFEIGPLVAGRYDLRASDRRARFARSAPLEVEAGTDGVVLALRAPSSIRGVALDARTREPVSGRAYVSTTTTGERRFDVSGARDGRIALDDVEPGTYAIAVATDDGRCGGVGSIVVGEREQRTGVEVLVEPAATILVRNLDAFATVQAEVWRGEVCFGIETIRRAESATFQVPAGAVSVRARAVHEIREHVTEFDIAAGTMRDLAFDGGWDG